MNNDIENLIDEKESLDPAIAQFWGKKVADLYNQQDHEALYATFNEQAKVKISHKKLETQLKNIFELFGEICEFAGKGLPPFFHETLENMYKLSGTVRDAIRVIGDIVFFKQQQERVDKFEESSKHLNAENKLILAGILQNKLDSDDM